MTTERLCILALAAPLAACPSTSDPGDTDAQTDTGDDATDTGGDDDDDDDDDGSAGDDDDDDDTTGDDDDDSGGEEMCWEQNVDDLCDPATATFSLDSTNQYYPLIVGSAAVLEGMDGDEAIRIERTVLADTEMVAGVETHVLEHREYIDDVLYEVARNFYVEAMDGTVCYFGEDVDFYENGEVANHDGSWRAGEDGAMPGIIMLADPMPGDAYFQENAPGVAVDQGQVEGYSTMTFLEMEYDDVLTVMDINPAEGCDEPEPKRYVPGIGEAADVDVVLIEYTPGGG